MHPGRKERQSNECVLIFTLALVAEFQDQVVGPKPSSGAAGMSESGLRQAPKCNCDEMAVLTHVSNALPVSRILVHLVTPPGPTIRVSSMHIDFATSALTVASDRSLGIAEQRK